MIPSLLANEVSAALREFIITGFETETEPFKGEFRRLVEEQQDGEAFIKGPYVSIGLPFVRGRSGRDFFSGFETEYPPHAHQEQAWNRLASDRLAANTLVATGTGSGKTECFMYPVLDHCRRVAGPGIKAIVIYPMNALATDQARRFAREIYNQPALKGLRVGLFVGGDGHGVKIMGPDQVITDKETLRQYPPDVLLTNYKMLDYLLMRPKDQALWAHNGPGTLRYLVVDELHTFDGAQGTDLALLIRRLRARLGGGAGDLICAGTSATLGGEDSVGGLLGYASDVFSCPFERDALILEQRLSDTEFLDNLGYLGLNPHIGPEDLAAALEKGLGDYLGKVYELYFSKAPETGLMTKEGAIALGRELKSHGQLANLLRQYRLSRGTPSFRELVQSLAGQVPRRFERQPEQLLIALLSLIAHARDKSGGPFVQLRLQLWSRELRRIVGTLREPVWPDAGEGAGLEALPPLLAFGDDQPPRDRPQVRLPLVQCRECHGTAWLTRMEASHGVDQVVQTDLQSIYGAFFSRHAETALLLPWQGQEPQTPAGMRLTHFRVCRDCGRTAALDYTGICKGCQAGNEALVRVSKPDQTRRSERDDVNRMVYEPDCPWCAARAALVVFGARAASLSAVAIHQLFSSRDNDDRRLLAFSDSVQDATHRAGFFAARTWHNNVRMALTQLLESQPGPVPLLELPGLFESFWLQRDGSQGHFDLPHYLREFMPPDKRFSADFEHFENTGEVRNAERHLRQIRGRMLWQLLEDLGWRSQVGRSLNRLGIASLDWPLEKAMEAAVRWRERVDNELGYRIDDAAAGAVMLGLVQHLVHLGAFGLEELGSYRAKGAAAFQLTFCEWAPRVGPGSPRPRYPAMGRSEGYEAVSVAAGRSWYENWLICLNPHVLVDRRQLEKVIMAALDALSESGLLLREVSDRGIALWMLNPAHLAITTRVRAVECAGYRSMHVPEVQASAWLDVPHISAAHPERVYQAAMPVRDSLYAGLYRHGEIHRVIAHEHTGLLSQSERERVEKSFMEGTKPWEYNLLSATPTLEMGIDIGKLSSVLLCSVPPAQANYLQRVGRGGRRDGNSFVLTVANGRPHDLVFYADPGRMLDTPVQPPAVFLKARHVLRRQLLAYAMDCWSRDAAGANVIPSTMQPVLDAVEKVHPDRFPYTMLDFIERNMQEVWDGFSTHVARELSGEDQELLRQYLFGGPQHLDDHLRLYLIGRLKLVVNERKLMSDTIRELDKQLDRLRRQPSDEHTRMEIAELEREAEGYRRMRIRLNRRETLNFFTDEGLLPNYAFPEEGATLHSVIFRTEQGGGDGAERELVKREYEYQRPAQAALTELAPESVFYAGNRKVKITRVETAKGRNIQDWRFCPLCHYSAAADEPQAGFNDKTCPRCHTPQWGDESARTRMLRMAQVYAYTNAKDTVLDDRSDDREPVFFNKQMLIDFRHDDVHLAWVLDDQDKPFGFEFIRSARFLEVNFGRREVDGLAFQVAGERIQRAGFLVCRECGSVQSRSVITKKTEASHLKSCSYARGPRQAADGREDAGIENCLYLYRQFSSEALRILLPRLSTGGTEAQVNSFVATLQLGLKRRFGGKVDHLQVAHMSEPVGGTDQRRHFIVLYDTVPGGTGYLHELLSRAEHMQSVFRKAYEVMSDCDCYDHTMDGCYRCLLEYRNSYGMESTSKALALQMLEDIVKSEAQWVRDDKGLSAIVSNPWIDSELEARFPEALAKFSGHPCVAGNKVRVSQDIVRGKHGYRLTIADQAYEIEPQVDLGMAEGVQFACRPDFVLWPVREGLTPVAVFLDGYQFHAGKLSEDLLKRQALMHAGFVVWTLNWFDINQVLGDKAVEVPLLSALTSPRHHRPALAVLAARAGVVASDLHLDKTTFELLMHYLCHQDFGSLRQQALFFALQCLPAEVLGDMVVKDALQESLSGLPAGFTDLLPEPASLVGAVQWGDASEGAVITLGLLAGRELLDAFDLEKVAVSLCYDLGKGDKDQARKQWQCFWTAFNLLQFLPAVYAWTPDSRHSGIAAGLVWPPRGEGKGSGVMMPRWFELLDASLASVLGAFDVPWPEDAMVGEAVMDDNGEVIGEAEILFKTQRIAFLLEDVEHQIGCKLRLEAEGWRVCTGAADLAAAVGEWRPGV